MFVLILSWKSQVRVEYSCSDTKPADIHSPKYANARNGAMVWNES